MMQLWGSCAERLAREEEVTAQRDFFSIHCLSLGLHSQENSIQQEHLNLTLTGFPGGSEGTDSACNVGVLGSIPE